MNVCSHNVGGATHNVGGAAHNVGGATHKVGVATLTLWSYFVAFPTIFLCKSVSLRDSLILV